MHFYSKATVTLKGSRVSAPGRGSPAGVVPGEFGPADRQQLCYFRNKPMSKISWSERARNCLASQLEWLGDRQHWGPVEDPPGR